MTAAADLIAETRRHLLAGAREEMNKLSLSVTDTQPEFSFSFDPGGIQRGALLSVDMELVYVWASSNTAKTATVERGYGGTTPAAHAQNALVTVNPRFPAFWVLEALNSEIASYASPSLGLYRIRTASLTYSAGTDSYDVAGDVLDVWEVRWEGVGGGGWTRLRGWEVIRDADAFPSGVGLRLREAPPLSGRPMRVRYKAPFAALTDLSDDVETVAGLHSEAHDIPPLGAAARLVAGREVRRSQFDAQPESRSAAEVPPGAAIGAARALLDLRNRRLTEEAARLYSLHPSSSRGVA